MVITVAVVVLIPLCRWWEWRKWTRGREILSEEELCRLFVEGVADRSFLLHFLSSVSKCYGVPMGQLRPTDSFAGSLGALDSWELGEGEESLAEALRKEQLMPPEPLDKNIKTLQDLFEACLEIKKQRQ